MHNFWAYSLASPQIGKYTPFPSLKSPVKGRIIKTMSTTTASYDRLKEIKEFDDSKLGVKGLLDSGITSIPKFFHHPPSTLPQPLLQQQQPSHNITIPVIDLSGPHSSVISQLHHSSSTLGFFQLINHGIPPSTIDRLLSAVQSFNEQPASVKSKHYHRDMGKGASFSTNFDLFQSKAASWRDTLQVRLSPGPLDWDQVPEIVREAVREWEKEVVRVGEELLGLLGEGLGLRRERLVEDTCLGGRTLVAHYYPYCPQSDLTVGITDHTDPGVLTLLVQNQVKGLQVKCGDGQWVDVDPLPGALVVNIGDILQILSNEEYKSVQHRVVANSLQEARVSVAVFFNPGNREMMYGPLAEMISPHKPPLYRHFLLTDYFKRFFTKELDGNTLTNFYKL